MDIKEILKPIAEALFETGLNRQADKLREVGIIVNFRCEVIDLDIEKLGASKTKRETAEEDLMQAFADLLNETLGGDQE